jgi:hypothetical protein
MTRKSTPCTAVLWRPARPPYPADEVARIESFIKNKITMDRAQVQHNIKSDPVDAPNDACNGWRSFLAPPSLDEEPSPERASHVVGLAA